MGNAIEVSDSLSNTEEQLERIAKIVGRGADRRKVFNAIYYHKAKAKTASQIAKKTHLSRMRVLQEGRYLHLKGVVRQTKKEGEVAYETIDFVQAHKREILGYADDPKKLAKLPTKRKVAVSLPKFVKIPTKGASVKRITIDDIDSFSKVRKIKGDDVLSNSMPENQFKVGIQAIVGEPGKFKDWGGEKSDFYSTRLRINGKRRAAAFALKGPGEKGKLVPGRMGKNGDQAPRLFQEEADVFIAQHWREIDPSVIDLMRSLAVAKSVSTGKPVWYGVIDGKDSRRLCLAYSPKFKSKSRR